MQGDPRPSELTNRCLYTETVLRAWYEKLAITR